MDLQDKLFRTLLTGALAAIAWVLFWSFFVPQVVPGWTWAGYDDFVVPVFAFGCVAGAAENLRS